MKLTTGLLAILALLLLTAAADKKDKDPDPTFKPGADVSIELTVKAPKGWHINYMLPLTVIFDDKLLKDEPFTVDKTVLSFKLKEYVHETVLDIPVHLKEDVKAGKLTVPFDLDYSICEETTENCTFDLQDIKIPLQVETEAPKGSKDRALAKGDLPATIQLPPAAI